MPLWKETRNLENPLFIFQGVSGRAERIDIFGNISPVAVKNGVILAEAGGQPATYRFPDMEKMPKMAGEFFESDFDWIIYPGKKQIFRGILRNPFPVSRNFDLRLELPEGIRSRSRKIAVTLPGNGTGKIAFPLESDAGFNLIRDDLREAVLKIYASGLEKKLFYPVRSSTSFPSSGVPKRTELCFRSGGSSENSGSVGTDQCTSGMERPGRPQFQSVGMSWRRQPEVESGGSR